MDKIKEGLLYLAGGALLIFLFFYGCSGHDIKKITTIPLQISKPTVQEIKQFMAKSVIHIIPVENKLGYVTKTKVIETIDNKIIQINEQKIDYGFRFKPGLILDGSLTGLGAGIRINYFSLFKANLDLNLEYPRVGGGISWQIFKNTSLGISYGYNYNKFVTEPSLYLSMGF